jgi:hypothetical protein
MPADGFPKVHILYKKGEEIIETEGSPFKMEQASIWDRNCNNGKEYKYKHNFKIPLRQYYYYFEAMAEGAMERKVTPIKEGPVVSPNLRAKEELAGLSWNSVDFGDINNDGWQDLVMIGEDVNGNPKTRLYKNEKGGFEEVAHNLLNLSQGSVIFFDANNDGFLDIFIAGGLIQSEEMRGKGYTYCSKVYINDGKGFYDSNQGFKEMFSPKAAILDFNNDGWMDIIMCGRLKTGKYTSCPIARLYKNDKGVFSEVESGLPNISEATIACADYNKDGLCDIFISGMNEASQIVGRLYKNDGAKFSDSGIELTGALYGSAIFFDYNNDGWLDLLVVGGRGYGQESVFGLYRNQGGEFVEEKTGIEGLNMAGASVGDYDNDGWSDIALFGMATSTYTKVYQNNKGVFLDSGIGLIPASHGNIRLVDIDRDGDLDLFIGATMKQSEYSWSPQARIYDSDTSLGRANNPPSFPIKGFEAVYATETLTLRWGKGTDTETPIEGLSYKVMVGTQSAGSGIISPDYDIIHNNLLVIKGVPSQRYYWSVKTIDTAVAESNWSKEQVFMPATKKK